VTTSYPGAVDNLTNPTPSDTLNSATVPHAAQHANTNDAIEAIQNTLGTNPQGTSATVKDRIVAAEGAIINLGLAVDDRVPGETGSNAPTGTLPNGYVWVDTSDNSIKVWNGSAWVDPSNAGGGGAAGIPWAAVTGGTVTEYTKGDGSVMEVHTFTADGTLTVVTPGYAEVLVVSGGGAARANVAGQNAGDGGRVLSGAHALTAGSLPVVVGAGGVMAVNDGMAGTSSLGSLNSGVAGFGNGDAGPTHGSGFVSSITGAAVTYGKFGGTATPNTGNSGGWSTATGQTGVVIVAVQKSAPTVSGVVASGGTETTYVGDGTNGVLGQSYKVHTFTADGSLIVTQGGLADVLIVGGGSHGGGGSYPGAGGRANRGLMELGAGTMPVTVGIGGNSSTSALPGTSSFGGITPGIAQVCGGGVGATGAGGTAADVTLGLTSSIDGTSKVYGRANAAAPVANRGDGNANGSGAAGVVIVRYKV
jgi:hypothetical protein